MNIIPVIDLMGGIVVHARAGHRDAYLPLESQLTAASDLLNVVADIIKFFPFKTIYLADLDAIAGKQIDFALYQQCLTHFPETTFWLDAGIRDQQDWQQFSADERLVMVLGSENLQALSLLTEIEQCILSLDFKQGQFLGKSLLWQQADYWPEHIIVMNLDRVGIDRGPDIDLIARIAARKPSAQLIGAGGVRDDCDLVLLEQAGVKEVLVATALHQGHITQAMLKQYQ